MVGDRYRPVLAGDVELWPGHRLGPTDPCHRRRVAGALKAMGIQPGDRVVGFMPNMPETIVAMLAATSLGATWSSCSPDFGIKGVLDRFGQIKPRVLFTADGYFFKGKAIDSLARIRQILEQIDTVEKVVVIPYTQTDPDIGGIKGCVLFGDFTATSPSPLEFRQLPFAHPLYIMYSSGTTGLPKCMVQSAGGILLQQMKEHLLHTDLRREDTLFYFTTCGWMMWNWLVCGPSVGYLAALMATGLKPNEKFDLSALRALLSTGSPLSVEGFEFVYRDIKNDLQLASISGGTDINGCFALGNPIGPVYAGELQCRGLGMKVEAFDENGQPVVNQQGELVCTAPAPSMPVHFWDDPDGRKYHAAYFDVYPGVWRHGDYKVEIAVKKTIQGEAVKNKDALKNPEILEFYAEIAELKEDR
jgi:acetoacetyl-CoA synthetase